MRVLIPQPLRSYTAEQDMVSAQGRTLNELLNDLDRQYPGIRFRIINEQDEIRPHVVLFVRGEKTRNLEESVDGCDEVVILQALSGG